MGYISSKDGSYYEGDMQVGDSIGDRPAPTIAEQNTVIQVQLDLADKKIIRALVENDQVRITAHKASQALLRSQLK